MLPGSIKGADGVLHEIYNDSSWAQSGGYTQHEVQLETVEGWDDLHQRNTLFPDVIFSVRSDPYNIRTAHLDYTLAGHEYCKSSVWDTVSGHENAIFSPQCDHATSQLGHFPTETWKACDRTWLCAERIKIPSPCSGVKLIVPVHGNGKGRLFAMARLFYFPGKLVIHDQGCVRCAMALCDELGISILIC